MNKKTFIVSLVLIVICLLIGLGVGYYLGKDSNKPEPEKPSDVIEYPTAKYDSEKFYFENLSKDGYGFIKVETDNGYELIQLTNTEGNKTILKFETPDDESIWNEPFHMQVVGNTFYFSIQYAEISNNDDETWKNKNLRLYAINFDNLEVKELINSSTFELTYDEYAISDEYIFLPRSQNVTGKSEDKVFRYDLKSLSKKVINDKLEADEIFVYNSKLYLKCEKKYYSMDFDGNNVTSITKDDYKLAKKQAGVHFETDNTDSVMYFMNNGKKVNIKDSEKLYYEDNLIYTAKKGETIQFYYTDEIGKVALYEYKYQNQSEDDPKYLMIDIETKKVVTKDEDAIENEPIYWFSEVIYK